MKKQLGSTLKSTAEHSIVYGLGSTVPALVGFLLLPILARSLTVEEFGIWAMLQTVTILTLSVFAFGLDSACIRSFYDYDSKDKKGNVVGSTVFMMLNILLILNLVGNLSAELISNKIFDSLDHTLLIRLIFFSASVKLINSIPLVVFRAMKRSKLFVSINSFSSIIQLILVSSLLIFFNIKIFGLICADIFISLLQLVLLFYFMLKDVKLKIDRHEISKLLKFGTPLVPARLFYAIVNTADRYFLSSMVSLSSVGVYSVGMKISQVIALVLTKPIQLIFPAMAFSIDKEKYSTEYYKKFFTYYVFVGLYFCLILSVFSKEILLLTGKQEYLSAGNIIPILSLSFLIAGLHQNLQIAIFVERSTYWIPLVAGSGALFNISLNWLLVNPLGAYGCALTLLLTRIFMATIVYYISQKLKKICYEWTRIGKILSVAVVMFLLCQTNLNMTIIYSILYKTFILLFFPVGLYLVQFFDENEKVHFQKIFTNWMCFLKTRIL